MRKSWSGLVSLVQLGMNLDAYEKSIFIFCGRSQKLIKKFLWTIFEDLSTLSTIRRRTYIDVE